jgi:hypothetical protein
VWFSDRVSWIQRSVGGQRSGVLEVGVSVVSCVSWKVGVSVGSACGACDAVYGMLFSKFVRLQ